MFYGRDSGAYSSIEYTLAGETSEESQRKGQAVNTEGEREQSVDHVCSVNFLLL